MIESLSDIPGSLIGFLWLLLMLLVAASFFARRDGFVAGQRAADRRNREQQKHDYNRGYCEGVRETLAHLRESGQLIEFREHPTEAIPERR